MLCQNHKPHIYSRTCLLTSHCKTHRRLVQSRASNKVAAPSVTTAEQAIRYACNSPKLLYALGFHPATRPEHAGKHLSAEELTEGKINFTFKVASSHGKSVLLKHAAPYVKAFGPDFALGQERLGIEAAAYGELHAHCPQHVPQLLLYDAAVSVAALQFLPPPFTKLMLSIHRDGLVLPDLARQLAQLLGGYLAGASAHALPPGELAARLHQYANRQVVEANEAVVLTQPFDATCSSNWHSPELNDEVERLRRDPIVLQALSEAVASYRGQRHTLIHNDLHTGNLLVSPQGGLYLIDLEFATYGPAAFDIGSLIGNLLLAFFALDGTWAEDAGGSRSSGNSSQGAQVAGSSSDHSNSGCDGARQLSVQQGWLLNTIEDFWVDLCARLHNVRSDKGCSSGGASPSSAAGGHGPSSSSSSSASTGSCSTSAATGGGLRSGSSHGHGCSSAEQGSSTQSSSSSSSGSAAPSWCDPRVLLPDVLGFAAFCMVRLVIGVHHYPGLLNIPDASTRVACERRVLEMARRLLHMRTSSAHMDVGLQAVTQLAMEVHDSV